MTEEKDVVEVKIVRNPDRDTVMFLHLNYLVSQVRLSSREMLHPDNPDSKTASLPVLWRISRFRGVQEVTFDRYKVMIRRSLAVDWDDMLPFVELTLTSAFKSAGGDLVKYPSVEHPMES